jgi:hypothetical protein
MNVSFDEEKENNSCCDFDLYKQPPFSRKKATLGSFVKDSSKEHLLNAIMRQADREGLGNTLAFPNRKKWILKNISVWFGNGGILAE